MKKRAVFLCALLVTGMLSACGETNASDIGTEYNQERQDNQIENNENLPAETNEDDLTNSIEGIIENQTFEIDLDEWGKVTFASIEPINNSNTPNFVLIKNGKIVYEFPKTERGNSDSFEQVSGVKFTDFNMDEKKDILVLIQYSNGENTWNVPVVFLQEFSDNMIYLDYPELESYKIEADTVNGVPFYHDKLLEAYISKQYRTGTLSDMEGVWSDYVDNLEGLYYQNRSIEKQIEIFAHERSQWAIDVDYADEKYCFTLADLDMDRRIELIVSNFGGTGFYTYSHFYKIGDDGTMKELETTFTEGDSQPDIMDEMSTEMDMTAFFYISEDGKGRNDFIVYDRLKDAPDRYIYRVSSLSIIDDVVTETKLANQRVTYEGEDYSEHTISQDYNGKKLTDSEYDNYPTTFYEALNAVKHTVHFQWKNVKDISKMSDSDVIEILTESYEKYSYR